MSNTGNKCDNTRLRDSDVHNDIWFWPLYVCAAAQGKVISNSKNIGGIIKQKRIMSGLTLRQLSDRSGVSPSHLGRIERGGRLPSAHVLRKIAQPLGFQEEALLIYAGYLSPQASTVVHSETPTGRLNPYVASVLAEDPVEVQRTVLGILTILKSIALAGGEERNDL